MQIGGSAENFDRRGRRYEEFAAKEVVVGTKIGVVSFRSWRLLTRSPQEREGQERQPRRHSKVATFGNLGLELGGQTGWVVPQHRTGSRVGQTRTAEAREVHGNVQWTSDGEIRKQKEQERKTQVWAAWKLRTEDPTAKLRFVQHFDGRWLHDFQSRHKSTTFDVTTHERGACRRSPRLADKRHWQAA